ncbi:ABC transporter periplasmic binding protein, urea carboxylase region [Atlantibacter hermannii]|nr:ABC transporter periplasmic binding protein, urea carboxylase region [Atlantibacter hermannii]
MLKARYKGLLLAALVLFSASAAAAKPAFKLCWSIYAGWMPWDYAQQSGIIKKWADKYNIDIQFVQVNDYIESVNQYTAGDLTAAP